MRLRELIICVSTAALVAGCSREGGKADQMTDANPIGPNGEIKITGCLTGAADRNAFVLTADRSALTSGALYSGSGEVPTYTYELVGGHDLASLVGRQVEIQGKLDKDRDDEIDVETEAKTTLPETKTRGNDTVTPAIETNEEIEINVRRVQVESVKPTGASCR